MHLDDTVGFSRFWEHVQPIAPSECWEWAGRKSRGWPELQVGEKIYKAHRVSYLLHQGAIPEHRYIAQTCGNRLCVNPQHLAAVPWHSRRPEDIPAHFWARVEKSATCWIWRGLVKRNGYGCFYADGRLRGAHRVSWELTNGPIPPGLCVCHNCPDGDNPLCVNPAHLFLGTVRENNRDRDRKGRTRTATKLTEEMVREIVALLRGGTISQRSIAARFGVSDRTINCIASGRNWQRVTMIPLAS